MERSGRTPFISHLGRLLMVLASVSGVCSPVAAQEDVSLGVLGLYGLNTHRADFRALPGVPNCCPAFGDGTGAGASFGVVGRMALAEPFRAEVRLGYTDLSGTLLRQEQTIVSGNRPGVFEHRVDATLRSLTIEPTIGADLFAGLTLFIGSRLEVGAISRFDQRETILQPSRGTFPNGRRTQNERVNAEIPNATALGLSLTGGLQWELPMDEGETVKLVPEVSYAYALTSVVSGLKWNVDQLRIGASIVWWPWRTVVPVFDDERILVEQRLNFIDTVIVDVAPRLARFSPGVDLITESTEENDSQIVVTRTLRRTDTLLRARRSAIEASISAVVRDGQGAEANGSGFNVEEVSSTILTPLLGYVFFEEGASTIPSRYRQLTPGQTAVFRETTVNDQDKLATYYHVLNILGSRLRQNPGTAITLVGCNADIAAETGNVKLSKARAKSVRDYLRSAWFIASDRIQIQGRGLPEKAANSQTTDGAQENRRVEIQSDDPSILAPVITRDTVLVVSPSTLELRCQVTSDRAVEKWGVELRQGETVLKTFSGSGAMPLSFECDMQQTLRTSSQEPITYTLTVIDEDGNRVERGGRLDVRVLTVATKRREKMADKEVDRFSLILFEIRSSELSRTNESIIGLIKPYIRPNSTIQLTGLTDRSGVASQNQSLAEQRARSAARALGVTERAVVAGVGNAVTYAPELPEGRLYTRTVDIVIETPVAP